MGPEIERRGQLAALLLLLSAAAQSGDIRRFDFTHQGNAPDHPAYDANRGFGFEPDNPSSFSVLVPEGNYRVVMKFARARERAITAIRAEQRRLMGEVRGRESQQVAFVVNVRTPELPPLPVNAPGSSRVALDARETGAPNWDDKLTLEVHPWPASLHSVEMIPVDLPTLYLAGDSTVADQAAALNASWGQFLPRYFDEGIAVANHAKSGETLKSFVTGLRLDKLLSNLRAGDWVMLQFGHNDQKAQWPQTYVDAATTYRSWLRTFIAEIRRRGATPLLVTSPERRHFDAQGRIRSTLGEYAAAMRAVAHEENVALLDLNALSVRFYEALGPDLAPRAFADEGRDLTHHSDHGARQLARAVIEALRGANPALTAGLEKHIAADAGRFDAARPQPPSEATP